MLVPVRALAVLRAFHARSIMRAVTAADTRRMHLEHGRRCQAQRGAPRAWPASLPDLLTQSLICASYRACGRTSFPPRHDNQPCPRPSPQLSALCTLSHLPL